MDWLIVSKRYEPDPPLTPQGSYGGGSWVPSMRGGSVTYGGRGYGIGKAFNIPSYSDKKFNISVNLCGIERSVRLTVKRNLPQINIKQVDGVARKAHIGDIENSTTVSVSNVMSGFSITAHIT